MSHAAPEFDNPDDSSLYPSSRRGSVARRRPMPKWSRLRPYALLAARCPLIIDTRNAFAARGIAGEKVIKA